MLDHTKPYIENNTLHTCWTSRARA